VAKRVAWEDPRKPYDETEGAKRRKALNEEYGVPQKVRNPGDILRALGLRGRIHPHSVVGFKYRDATAFAAYSESNSRNRGFRTYGPLMTSEGCYGVIDLRPALPADDIYSPLMADDYSPRH
jgi:hypothetical protein